MLTPVITNAGLTAAFNASNTGLAAEITHIALGNGAYTPLATMKALTNELQRVPVSGGSSVSPTQIHITALADGVLEFWVKEVGFYLADGTLFALWSDPVNPLAFKANGVDLLLAFDFVLAVLPAGSVKVAAVAAPLNLFMADELAQLATAQIDTMTRQMQLDQRLLAGGL